MNMALNKAILESITLLNNFQGKGYKWAAGLDGSTDDVLWPDNQGEMKPILRGNPDKLTYCCGLTLQAYLMACNKIGKHLGDYNEVMNIRRTWFIAQNVKQPIWENRGPLDALEPVGHGIETTLEQAIPGDLVQLWRKSGSGHSVIFQHYFTENGVKALKYWSTQTATGGIGYRTEYFEGVKNPITHVHICRPI